MYDREARGALINIYCGLCRSYDTIQAKHSASDVMRSGVKRQIVYR